MQSGQLYTPYEIKVACATLAKDVGPKALVSASVDSDACDSEAVWLIVRVDGLCGDRRFSVRAPDWPEAFEAARAKWDEMRDEFEDRRIRDMALAIIRATDELGACSDAALRAEEFTDDEIAYYGDAACARADRMAGNGPFEIARIGVANGAPAA